MIRRVASAVMGFAFIVACNGDEDPPPTAADLEKVAAADGQSASAGARLAAPLAVTVLATDGATVTRGAVRWVIASGTGASTSDSVTYSDGTGRAEVALTLGLTTGAYSVRAELVENTEESVLFDATATDAPVLASVTPATFAGGDTLVIAGTNLNVVTAVEVSGAPARVLAVAAASITAIAPVCIVPGSTNLRAKVGGTLTNTLPVTYTSGTVRLAVGDYASIDPEQLQGCATFPAADAGGAEYILVPQSVTGSPGQQADYVLSGDAVVIPVPPAPAATPLPADRFHDFLRMSEVEFSRRPRPFAAVSAAPSVADAAQVTVRVGDRREFRVCSEIGCNLLPTFAAITAEAKYVGEHAAIFLDVAAAAAGGFVQTDFDSIGAIFDRDLYEVDTRAFGAESDVDENGVVVILMTPVVNGLTPREQCQTSIITGFFFGLDIDPIFQQDERSNKGEVFYTLAPDPAGETTCSISTTLVRRLVPVTFIHEFQHMISYYQHVLLRSGSAEELWLNEALSHFAEELGGRHFRDSDPQTFANFTIGDLLNGYLYLRTPGDFFAIEDQGAGSLQERGANWLFVRWLVDQFGDDVTRRLLETRLTGHQNVASVTGEPMSTLLSQWFLANYVSDLPGFSAPARMRYTSWAFRTTYASLHDQLPSRFDLAFPIVPETFGVGPFSTSGTLRSGSGEFFRINQAPNERGFTVRMTAPAGGSLPGTITARLNVIRVR